MSQQHSVLIASPRWLMVSYTAHTYSSYDPGHKVAETHCICNIEVSPNTLYKRHDEVYLHLPYAIVPNQNFSNCGTSNNQGHQSSLPLVMVIGPYSLHIC